MLILGLTELGSKITAPGAERPLIRLNFLSHLLREGLEYMQEVLSTGLLSVQLGECPFNRDVELSPKRAGAVLQYYKDCARDGVAVFTAPESRCSLLLKRDEIVLSQREGWGSVSDLLLELQRSPVIDILDESDEILKHKFQLVKYPSVSSSFTLSSSLTPSSITRTSLFI